MQPPVIKLTVFNPIYNNKQIKSHNFFVDIKNIFYLCSRKEAQMAESVDALVSNTSGATRAGSTPALGTEYRLITKLLSTYIISLGSKNNIFTTNFSTF